MLTKMLLCVVQKLVLTTRSVEYMPFFLSLACFANGLAWSTYALIQFDPFILVISHSLSLSLSLSMILSKEKTKKLTKDIYV
jgi:solute carrier family 50 protein (sugar transporter)